MLPLVLLVTQSPALTITAPATRLERLLPEISKRLGTELIPVGPIKDAVVVVRLDKAPIAEVMARLAEVTYAEWEKTPSGYKLARSVKKERELRRLALNERAADIAAAIAKASTRLVEKPEFDDAEAKQLLDSLLAFDKARAANKERDFLPPPTATFQRGPASRALLKILRAMPPEVLASVPQGTTATFSNRPTALQSRLPVDVEPILKALAREQSVWQGMLERRGAERPEQIYGGDPRLDKRDGGTPVRAIVTFSSFGPASELSFRLYTVDAEGRRVLGGEVRLNPEAILRARERFQAAESAGKEGDYPLSPASMRMLQRLDLRYANAAPPLTEADHARLRRPDEVDPLSVIPSELLIESARRRKTQLVGALADDLIRPADTVLRSGKVNLDRYVATLDAASTEVMEDAGWLTVRPRFTPWGHRPNVDRRALGRLMNGMMTRGYLTLEELGGFANEVYLSWSPIMFFSLMEFAPRSERLYQDVPWAALRVYGALQPAQQAMLRAGQPLRLPNLTPALENALIGVVTSPHAFEGFQVVNREVSILDAQALPTEAIPDGLKGGIALAAQPTQTERVCAATTGDGRTVAWTNILHPGQLNEQRQRQPGLYGPGARYWYGPVRRVRLDLQIGSGPVLRADLKETGFDLRTSGVAYESLPASIRNAAPPANPWDDSGLR